MSHARDGTGSVIIIDRRGFILTCHHVIADADTVFVRLPAGRRLEPAEIYADAFTDLAVIRIVGAGDLSGFAGFAATVVFTRSWQQQDLARLMLLLRRPAAVG